MFQNIQDNQNHLKEIQIKKSNNKYKMKLKNVKVKQDNFMKQNF